MLLLIKSGASKARVRQLATAGVGVLVHFELQVAAAGYTTVPLLPRLQKWHFSSSNYLGSFCLACKA